MEKKILLPGFLFIAAIFSTGCLGKMPEQILGEWIYAPMVDPNQHEMHWTFIDNGQVYFHNVTTAVYDTGTYEMFPDGTHNIVKVSGTDIEDSTIPMNGEWIIVKLDGDKLIMGNRDYGGFIQRDFYR